MTNRAVIFAFLLFTVGTGQVIASPAEDYVSCLLESLQDSYNSKDAAEFLRLVHPMSEIRTNTDGSGSVQDAIKRALIRTNSEHGRMIEVHSGPIESGKAYIAVFYEYAKTGKTEGYIKLKLHDKVWKIFEMDID